MKNKYGVISIVLAVIPYSGLWNREIINDEKHNLKFYWGACVGEKLILKREKN